MWPHRRQPTRLPPSLGFSRQEHWSGLPFPSPMQESEKWKWSLSVMPDSSRPHRLQPTRLLRPWDFPGKSTGVGCHGLLQKERLESCYSPSPPSVPVVIVFKLLDKNTFFWDRKLALWKIFIFLFFESCLRQCWPEKIWDSLPPVPSQLMAGLSMLCSYYRKDPEETR